MTAHILVPVLDSENCSTISKKTLNYLRDTLGFQGVIVSDSLVMEGVVTKYYTVEEAAIQALNAGCDILILGGRMIVGNQAGMELTLADIQRIHGDIVNAVKSGRLKEVRLDEAVEKILDLKKRYIVPEAERLTLSQEVNTTAHQLIAQKVASLALRATKTIDNLSLREKKVVVFAPQLLRDNINQTSLLKIGKTTSAQFFNSISFSSNEIDVAKQNAGEADVLFVCSYNAWKNPSQITFIQSLIDIGKPVVLLVMRDPLDASLFPNAHSIFTTFSPSVPSIQALCDAFKPRKKSNEKLTYCNRASLLRRDE